MDKRKTKDGWIFRTPLTEFKITGFRSKVYSSPEERDVELEKYKIKKAFEEEEILKRQKEEKILMKKYDE